MGSLVEVLGVGDVGEVGEVDVVVVGGGVDEEVVVLVVVELDANVVSRTLCLSRKMSK